jgi:hypothetical protein
MDYFWLGSPRGTIMKFDKYPVFMATSDNEDLKAMFTLKKVEFERSTSREVTLESLGLRKTEFICNVDASKINSPSVGSFYAKNKKRIEKLNSEFSCKILEALVYLSDYENCGGGIELPAKKVEEVDDLLGEIRNL